MTVHYPDISAYQAGIPVSGPAVCIKATEGTGWANKDYGPALARARAAGTFAFAYAFLHAGNAQAQAGFCHQVAGGTPLMLDFEPTTGSRPGMGDAIAFLDEYRRLGGVCHLTYLPRWYWEQIGRPSLAPLAGRGHGLVSSNYTYYTDDPAGAGWAPYGGMAPQVWQYTAQKYWNGQPVDFNAYRGTLVNLIALVTGGHKPPVPAAGGPVFPYGAGHYLGQPSPSPFCHSGYWGGPDHAAVHAWQAQMAARGWTAITLDGRFGPQSEDTARLFQGEKGLQVDGRVGRDTWTATWNSPVTT